MEALVAGITAPAAIPQKTFPEVDGLEKYVRFVAAAGGEKRVSRRIVIDISNGSSGPVFTRLAEVMGVDAVILNAEPDGTFPHHDPNPLKEESQGAGRGARWRSRAPRSA